MRGLFTSAHDFTFNLAQDAKAFVHAHFGNHLGGSPSGIFIRVPFTRLSAFIEHAPVTVGFGIERSEGTLEVFAGRVRAVLCVEPKAAW